VVAALANLLAESVRLEEFAAEDREGFGLVVVEGGGGVVDLDADFRGDRLEGVVVGRPFCLLLVVGLLAWNWRVGFECASESSGKWQLAMFSVFVAM
jgi:hypothetical protein